MPSSRACFCCAESWITVRLIADRVVDKYYITDLFHQCGREKFDWFAPQKCKSW